MRQWSWSILIYCLGLRLLLLIPESLWWHFSSDCPVIVIIGWSTSSAISLCTCVFACFPSLSLFTSFCLSITPLYGFAPFSAHHFIQILTVLCLATVSLYALACSHFLIFNFWSTDILISLLLAGLEAASASAPPDNLCFSALLSSAFFTDHWLTDWLTTHWLTDHYQHWQRLCARASAGIICQFHLLLLLWPLMQLTQFRSVSTQSERSITEQSFDWLIDVLCCGGGGDGDAGSDGRRITSVPQVPCAAVVVMMVWWWSLWSTSFVIVLLISSR